MSGRGGVEITQVFERNQEATLYVGNLDARVDEELLWEIFVQCGVVRNVHIPRDKITGVHSNYGFVEYEQEMEAEYGMKILNMIKVYNKPMRCNKASQDKRTLEVGANLFVGNLDSEVDEKMLHDTFAAFGSILSTKTMRDPETGESRGFGFVAFDSFEASDAALAAMNGQFLCNRPIHVSYAYKKDTKGDRHGSAAERLIAANKPRENQLVPPGQMASIPGTTPPPLPVPMEHMPRQPSEQGMMPMPGMMPHGMMPHGMMSHGMMPHGMMPPGLMHHGMVPPPPYLPIPPPSNIPGPNGMPPIFPMFFPRRTPQ